MQNRKGEPARLQLRREDRVYLLRGSWHIETREGLSLGPYASKYAALQDAGRLKQTLENIDDEDDLIEAIKNFVVCDNYPEDPLNDLDQSLFSG